MAGTEARPTIKRFYLGGTAVPGRLQSFPGEREFSQKSLRLQEFSPDLKLSRKTISFFICLTI